MRADELHIKAMLCEPALGLGDVEARVVGVGRPIQRNLHSLHHVQCASFYMHKRQIHTGQDFQAKQFRQPKSTETPSRVEIAPCTGMLHEATKQAMVGIRCIHKMHANYSTKFANCLC